MPVFRPPFRVPDRAIRNGTDASIKLQVYLDGDGSVESARVLESQPPGLLDRAAKSGVRRWKYKPLVVDGVGVRRWSEPVTVFLFFDTCPDLGPEIGDHLKICGRSAP